MSQLDILSIQWKFQKHRRRRDFTLPRVVVIVVLNLPVIGSCPTVHNDIVTARWNNDVIEPVVKGGLRTSVLYRFGDYRPYPFTIRLQGSPHDDTFCSQRSEERRVGKG